MHCAPRSLPSAWASSPEHRSKSSPTRTTLRCSHASGCTSNGHEAAQLYGDDIAHRAAFFLIDPTNPAEVLAFYRAYVGAGRPPEVREAILEDAIANAGPRARDSFAAMCEVAQRFAGWLELGPGIEGALEYVFARWDGRGFPNARGD